jgi:uncharacterized Fe-S radical SAM superfamily protein PflX
LPHAIVGGLRLPIVYNTSSYDSLDSLQLMDGIVDVYAGLQGLDAGAGPALPADA